MNSGSIEDSTVTHPFREDIVLREITLSKENSSRNV